MRRVGILALIMAAAATLAAEPAAAHGWQWNRRAARHAEGMSWHAPYYHTATGMPVALVVPPTAHMQTKWSWGVSQGTMTSIYHQFRRPYFGEGADGGAAPLNGTPSAPSHSDQFGVYYIRGPW